MLNQRFREGRPSKTFEQAGVLIRLLDAHAGGEHAWGLFYSHGPQSSFWSSTIVNRAHPELIRYQLPGFVLAPAPAQGLLLCSYPSDGATIYSANRSCQAGDEACLPGCLPVRCTEERNSSACYHDAHSLDHMLAAQDRRFGVHPRVWRGFQVPCLFTWNEVVLRPPAEAELPGLVQAVVVPLHDNAPEVVRAAEQVRADFLATFRLDDDAVPLLLYDAWDAERPFRPLPAGAMLNKTGPDTADYAAMTMDLFALATDALRHLVSDAEWPTLSAPQKAVLAAQAVARLAETAGATLVDWAMLPPKRQCAGGAPAATDPSVARLARAAMGAFFKAFPPAMARAVLQFEAHQAQGEVAGEGMLLTLLADPHVRALLASHADGFVAWLATVLCTPTDLGAEGFGAYVSALDAALSALGEPDRQAELLADGVPGFFDHFVRGIATDLEAAGLSPGVADAWHATASERLGQKLAMVVMFLCNVALYVSLGEVMVAMDRQTNTTACALLGAQIDGMAVGKMLCALGFGMRFVLEELLRPAARG